MATKHILRIEDDKGRREISLEAAVYSIGRDPKSDIRLFSLFVSRRHATLVQQQREDGSLHYQILDGDLNGKLTANGLCMNGRRFQSHNLKSEDEIVFGPGVRAIYYEISTSTI